MILDELHLQNGSTFPEIMVSARLFHLIRCLQMFLNRLSAELFTAKKFLFHLENTFLLQLLTLIFLLTKQKDLNLKFRILIFRKFLEACGIHQRLRLQVL